MNDLTKQRLRKILTNLNALDYIKPDSVPDIALYMDQLTTFMDSELASCKRYENDKLLTKTMINNYTKNDLLPPPEKKKYSKDHLHLLIFIYYLKSFLSISDIQAILEPMTEKFHVRDCAYTLDDIYREIYDTEVEQSGDVARDIIRRFLQAGKKFQDAPVSDEDRDYLQMFSFICMLSFDIYVKKQIIEQLVDGMTADEPLNKK